MPLCAPRHLHLRCEMLAHLSRSVPPALPAFERFTCTHKPVALRAPGTTPSAMQPRHLATPRGAPAPRARLQGKRMRSLRTRTLSTFAMIGGFALFVYLGHVPLVLLVLALQVRQAGRRQPGGGVATHPTALLL